MCSYKLNHAIGAHLAKHAPGQRGILKSAYEKGVPVFVPAFTDSELGLDVALNNRLRESTGRHKMRFDPFEDLEHFAATLLRQTRWELSPSAAASRATGRSNSGRLSNFVIAAWARTFP